MNKVMRERIKVPEGVSIELELACVEMGLTVVLVPDWHDQAIFKRSFECHDPIPFRLFIWEGGVELIEHTIKQCLADLGHPDYQDVEIEPFGRLPGDPRAPIDKGPHYPPAWRNR